MSDEINLLTPQKYRIKDRDAFLSHMANAGALLKVRRYIRLL